MTEIEIEFDKGSFDDAILGGDFNYDKRRKSWFVKTMNKFLYKLGLVSVWEKLKLTSHFICSYQDTVILPNCSKEIIHFPEV